MNTATHEAQLKLAAARQALDDAASRGFPAANQPHLTAAWRAAEAELYALSDVNTAPDEPPADGAGADLTLSPEAEAELSAGLVSDEPDEAAPKHSHDKKEPL
ncbi:MAG: hypothetical protein IPM06_21370 [Rhizobiales bacterium]|nr:hypothetical protein [Hyphomicrobiales bacterium]